MEPTPNTVAPATPSSNTTASKPPEAANPASTITAPSTQPSPPPQPEIRTGKCTLLLFASASTFVNNLETLSLPAPTSLRELFKTLEERWPGIGRKVLRHSAFTVNLEYVDFEWEETSSRGVGQGDDVRVEVGDEVGIVPPVSSG